MTWAPCLAFAAGSLLAVAGWSPRVSPGRPVAALFPPWWSAPRALAAASAGGMPVRFGAAGFVVIVMPDIPDAMQRLRQAGAWLLLDPKVLGGCVAT